MRAILPKAKWRELPAVMPHCRTYAWGDTRVLVGEEPGIGWHLSISTPIRYPTWDEVRAARYDLVPNGVTMAMLLPPEKEYVNVHDYCFHLYQIPNEIGGIIE